MNVYDYGTRQWDSDEGDFPITSYDERHVLYMGTQNVGLPGAQPGLAVLESPLVHACKEKVRSAVGVTVPVSPKAACKYEA